MAITTYSPANPNTAKNTAIIIENITGTDIKERKIFIASPAINSD